MLILTSIMLNAQQNYINPKGTTIDSRIETPNGYSRIEEDQSSYTQYLRNLPLKSNGAQVEYFDGSFKENYNVYVAVIDQEIGNRDLHQCADAIMRLRADYLWQSGRYNEIHFNFTNGWRVDYSKWMNGNRIRVRGNKTSWVHSTSPSNSYNTYWKYMQMIFAYAGSLSLSGELVSVDINDMKIGDVFIQGGTPGHAVIIVDMAINKNTNEKVFLLAQSYMPAQQTQILTNPNNEGLSPWYYLNDINSELITPEYYFSSDQLMRFD